MIKCPQCGRENADEVQLCVRCGAPLVDIGVRRSTRIYDDTDYEEGVPKWGTARFNGKMNLVLEVLHDRKTFTFDANAVDNVVIGRIVDENPDTSEVDVDLTPNGGLDKGVSRRHAMIAWRDGALHIIDNNSANGTYLNGQRLIPQQPRILRDGDDIRLGHLTVRVNFQRG